MFIYVFVLCHYCIYDFTGGRGDKYWFVLHQLLRALYSLQLACLVMWRSLTDP